jgi:hypothetical protein
LAAVFLCALCALPFKIPMLAVQGERAEERSCWQKAWRFRLLGKGGCDSRLRTFLGVSHIVWDGGYDFVTKLSRGIKGVEK